MTYGVCLKMNLKNDYLSKTEAFAKKHSLICGCGSAEPFYEYADILSRQVPFVNYGIEERTDPSLTLEGAKSLVALGLSYNAKYKAPDDGIPRARLSEGAVGEDYHTVMKKLLSSLAHELFDGTDEKYMFFCDTGPLSDCLVALRCSLGCMGRNNGIINKKFGSAFFIGYIITTAEIEPSPKADKLCSGCGKCVKACPSGALRSPSGFDHKKCVAYLTQKKGIIPDELKKYMGTYIYGCDICRRVCPLTPAPEASEGCAYPDIKKLLLLTDREFRALYGNTAIGWRGRRTIMRNALIALGNIGTEDAARLAAPFLESPHEDIRDAALWAYNSCKTHTEKALRR